MYLRTLGNTKVLSFALYRCKVIIERVFKTVFDGNSAGISNSAGKGFARGNVVCFLCSLSERLVSREEERG